MLGASHFDRATLSYGLAHFGKSLFWYSSEILFAFYLSEVSHLPVAWMGVVLAAGFLCGAAADLMVGKWLAPWLSGALGAARLQMTGAALCAVTLSLFFASALMPETWRLAYALIVGMGFRVSYALYDLPQNALLSLATGDDDARSRVASLRLFFSGAASLLMGVSIGPLLSGGIGDTASQRFFLMSLALGLVAVLTAVNLHGVLRRNAPASQGAGKMSLRLRTVLSGFPPAIWIVVAMSLVTASSVSVFGKIEPYYAAYVLQAPVWGGLIMASAACGQAVSQPLWSLLSLRLDRVRLITVCAWLLIGAAGLFWVCARSPQAAFVCAFVFGAASGGMGMVQWAAFGDSVARQAGAQTGAAYGLLTAAIKVALAISGLLIGFGLDLFDYRGSENGGLVPAMCVPVMAGAALVLLLCILPPMRRKA